MPNYVPPSRRQVHIARIYGQAAPAGSRRKETFLEKNRRKVTEQKLANKLAVPTHRLATSKVIKAPAAFIDDYKRQAAARARPIADPTSNPVPNPIRAPRRTMRGSADDPKPMPRLSMAQREERLRALAAGRTLPSTSPRPSSTVTTTPAVQSKPMSGLSTVQREERLKALAAGRSLPSPATTVTTSSTTPATQSRPKSQLSTFKVVPTPTVGIKRPREEETTPKPTPESKRSRPSAAARPLLHPTTGPKYTPRPDEAMMPKPGKVTEAVPFEKPKGPLGMWDGLVPYTSSSSPRPTPTRKLPEPRGDGFIRRERPSRSATPESGVDRSKKMVKKPPPSIFMPVHKAKLKSR